MSRPIAVLIAVVTAIAIPAAAAPPVPDQPPVCRFPGEPAPTPAQRERLDKINIDINSLADHADCRPLRERLRQLINEPCFRALQNLAPLPECGSAPALRDWWEDGGNLWFRSAATDTPGSRSIDLPPGMRATLGLDGNGGHTVAALLCRADDSTCGSETQGWLKRADDAIVRDRYLAGRGMKEVYPTEACKNTKAATPSARYAEWRTCIEQARRQRRFNSRLPLGWFRAPTEGWLVVRGRRGHYTFTDELAAFDLATGAAFRARRDGDLGIGPAEDAEAIERRKTGTGKVAVERGRVSVDNLREAALLTFLWPARRRQLMKISTELPPNVEVMPLPKGFANTKWDEVIHTSSGDTWLSWDWIRRGKPVVSGTLQYSTPGHDGGDPAWLLEVAEAGLQPGCPPVPLPPGVLGRGAPMGGVSPLDASRDQLDEAEVALAIALTEPDPACVTPKANPTPGAPRRRPRGLPDRGR